MSRTPTPQEIMDTNPNMTKQCDKCDLIVRADANYGTFQNMLTLTMSGGYGEYVDSYALKPEELEFYLCHKCAHKLMAQFFSQWEFMRWHPRTKDRYCDGWTMPTWEAMMEP
jgi:hypothetical protein